MGLSWSSCSHHLVVPGSRSSTTRWGSCSVEGFGLLQVNWWMCFCRSTSLLLQLGKCDVNTWAVGHWQPCRGICVLSRTYSSECLSSCRLHSQDLSLLICSWDSGVFTASKILLESLALSPSMIKGWYVWSHLSHVAECLGIGCI